LIALQWRNDAIQRFATIVLLQHLAIGDWGNFVIIKLQPSRLSIRLDKCEIMSTISVSGVHQNTMQLVVPLLRAIGVLVQELREVDLKWKFMTIIDLQAINQ